MLTPEPLSWEELDDTARAAVRAVAGYRYPETHGHLAEQHLITTARAAAREAGRAPVLEGTVRRACHYAAMRAVRLELRRQLEAARRPA